jgi:hypothetical protein
MAFLLFIPSIARYGRVDCAPIDLASLASAGRTLAGQKSRYYVKPSELKTNLPASPHFVQNVNTPDNDQTTP